MGLNMPGGAAGSILFPTMGLLRLKLRGVPPIRELLIGKCPLLLASLRPCARREGSRT